MEQKIKKEPFKAVGRCPDCGFFISKIATYRHPFSSLNMTGSSDIACPQCGNEVRLIDIKE